MFMKQTVNINQNVIYPTSGSGLFGFGRIVHLIQIDLSWTLFSSFAPLIFSNSVQSSWPEKFFKVKLYDGFLAIVGCKT